MTEVTISMRLDRSPFATARLPYAGQLHVATKRRLPRDIELRGPGYLREGDA